MTGARRGSFSLLRGLLLGVALSCALPALAQQQTDLLSPSARFKKAQSLFEHARYAEATRELSVLVDVGHFESATLRAEAYRLLGLSLLAQGRRDEAGRAFIDLLEIDPFTELDPFFVEPEAIAFFEKIKRDAEPQLAPLREQKRKIAQEEIARKRQREQDLERRRLTTLQPSVERRVIQHEFWVSLLPFGVGQFQNGDRSLGVFMASSQLLSGAASVISAVLIEELRNSSSGRFNPTVYPLAARLQVVKYVGAGLFYGLWAVGAIHASVRFKPESPLPDRILPPQPELLPSSPGAPSTPPQAPAPGAAPAPAPAPGAAPGSPAAPRARSEPAVLSPRLAALAAPQELLP